MGVSVRGAFIGHVQTNGGTRRSVDVHIIAMTNRDLADAASPNEFRRDLTECSSAIGDVGPSASPRDDDTDESPARRGDYDQKRS